jgi:hypothetical protein
MGRKGVSKRKPKKSKSDPKHNNNHGSSVQSLVNSKDAPLNRERGNPADPSKKKTPKGK